MSRKAKAGAAGASSAAAAPSAGASDPLRRAQPQICVHNNDAAFVHGNPMALLESRLAAEPDEAAFASFVEKTPSDMYFSMDELTSVLHRSVKCSTCRTTSRQRLEAVAAAAIDSPVEVRFLEGWDRLAQESSSNCSCHH